MRHARRRCRLGLDRFMTICRNMAYDDMQYNEITAAAQRPKMHAALRCAAIAVGLLLAIAPAVLLIAPAALAIEPMACDATMRAQQVAQLLVGRNVADQVRVT